MKKLYYKKYELLFIMIIATLLLSITMVNRIDAEVNDVNLILSENGEKSLPIFDGSDPLLAPGININKKFNIQNKTKESYFICGIKVNNFKLKDFNDSEITDLSKLDYFCEKVKCKIQKVRWINNQIYNETIYEGKLADLVAQNGIVISNESLIIANGSKEKFAMEIGMDNTDDNTLQGFSANLNIEIVAISKDNNNINGITSLTKTGTFFDTTSLIAIGTLLVVIGIVIRIKKEKDWKTEN